MWAGVAGTRHVLWERECLGGLPQRQEEQVCPRCAELVPKVGNFRGKILVQFSPATALVIGDVYAEAG